MKKPIAYKDTNAAIIVALCGSGHLVQVSGSLCEDGKDGVMVVTDDHRMWDDRGDAYLACHRCLRLPKGEPDTPGFRPGKWEVRLEPTSKEAR